MFATSKAISSSSTDTQEKDKYIKVIPLFKKKGKKWTNGKQKG